MRSPLPCSPKPDLTHAAAFLASPARPITMQQLASPQRPASASVSSASTSSTISLLTQVCNELLSTERTYVSSITTLHTKYIQAIRAKFPSSVPATVVMNGPHPHNGQDAWTLCDGALGSIVKLHVGLTHDLEVACKQDATTTPAQLVTRVAQVFLKHKDYFRMYSAYFDAHNSCLTALEHGDKKLTQFIEIQNLLHGQGQNLRSYLIMPIQRIPRYEMMLERMESVYKKEEKMMEECMKGMIGAAEGEEKMNTDDSVSSSIYISPSSASLLQATYTSTHTASKLLQDSRSSIHSLNQWLNEWKRDSESAEKLYKLTHDMGKNGLPAGYNILESHRRYITDMSVYQVYPNARRALHVWLTNDTLILVSEDKYKLKGWIPLWEIKEFMMMDQQSQYQQGNSSLRNKLDVLVNMNEQTFPLNCLAFECLQNQPQQSYDTNTITATVSTPGGATKNLSFTPQPKKTFSVFDFLAGGSSSSSSANNNSNHNNALISTPSSSNSHHLDVLASPTRSRSNTANSSNTSSSTAAPSSSTSSSQPTSLLIFEFLDPAAKLLFYNQLTQAIDQIQSAAREQATRLKSPICSPVRNRAGSTPLPVSPRSPSAMAEIIRQKRQKVVVNDPIDGREKSTYISPIQERPTKQAVVKAVAAVQQHQQIIITSAPTTAVVPEKKNISPQSLSMSRSMVTQLNIHHDLDESMIFDNHSNIVMDGLNVTGMGFTNGAVEDDGDDDWSRMNRNLASASAEIDAMDEIEMLMQQEMERCGGGNINTRRGAAIAVNPSGEEEDEKYVSHEQALAEIKEEEFETATNQKTPSLTELLGGGSSDGVMKGRQSGAKRRSDGTTKKQQSQPQTSSPSISMLSPMPTFVMEDDVLSGAGGNASPLNTSPVAATPSPPAASAVAVSSPSVSQIRSPKVHVAAYNTASSRSKRKPALPAAACVGSSAKKEGGKKKSAATSGVKSPLRNNNNNNANKKWDSSTKKHQHVHVPEKAIDVAKEREVEESIVSSVNTKMNDSGVVSSASVAAALAAASSGPISAAASVASPSSLTSSFITARSPAPAIMTSPSTTVNVLKDRTARHQEKSEKQEKYATLNSLAVKSLEPMTAEKLGMATAVHIVAPMKKQQQQQHVRHSSIERVEDMEGEKENA